MAIRNRNKKQFDEFFGSEQRKAPAREGYSVNEDVFFSGTGDPRKRAPSRFNLHSSAPAAEGGSSAKHPAGSRAEAVQRRFGGGYDGGRVRRPGGRFHRRGDSVVQAASGQTHRRPDMPAAGMSRPMPQTSPQPPHSGNDFEFEYERKPKNTAKKIALWTAAVIAALALIAVTVFLLRPTDGGDYFRRSGTLPQVENIRQTQAFKNSVWLDWDPVEGVAGYRIYRSENGHAVQIKTALLSGTVITGLEQGSSGDYIIRPFCKTPGGEYEEPNALIFTLKTKSAGAGMLEHENATASSVTLVWQPAAGADGYELERRVGFMKWESCGETEAAQITVSALDPSSQYIFRMRPYTDIGTKRCYGGWTDKFTSCTSPVMVTGLSQGDTTDSGYMLTWNVGSEATGFELYRADAETGQTTELIGQCGTQSYEIAGLESVNFSSYRVRAFLRHDSGVSYGEFSDVLTAVTLPSKVEGVDQYTASNGSYSIFWQPADRAEGYEIYAYSCHRGEYYLLTSMEDARFTLEDISQYAERYKVRAYVSLGDLKFFGQFSEEMPCHPYAYLNRKVTVDKDTTAMRTAPGPEHELIKEVRRGTTARVFGEKSGTDGSRWFRVELNDGMTGWISREDVDITNVCKTLTARTYTDEQPIVIYLSPSRQGGNPYIIGSTTEKEQMEAVAAVTHRILAEEYNCVVYTATPDLELRERAFEALELKADVYLAIHSNATGTGDIHYGASSYYCGASGRSKKLGENINKNLNAIAPKKCTLNKQMYSALESFGGVGYAEVRDPYNLGMVTVLAETDFHDNELTAQWIIDNHEAIGRAYAEALAETFDIDRK